jgi:ribosome-associated protein
MTEPQPAGGSPSGKPDPPVIRLDHFLQACGIPTGGQAKQLIQQGHVRVNGQVETRRRRKLVAGDEVGWDNQEFVVAAGSDEADGSAHDSSGHDASAG